MRRGRRGVVNCKVDAPKARTGESSSGAPPTSINKPSSCSGAKRATSTVPLSASPSGKPSTITAVCVALSPRVPTVVAVPYPPKLRTHTAGRARSTSAAVLLGRRCRSSPDCEKRNVDVSVSVFSRRVCTRTRGRARTLSTLSEGLPAQGETVVEIFATISVACITIKPMATREGGKERRCRASRFCR